MAESLDWEAVERLLDADGFTRVPAMLTPDQCVELAALYKDEARFRSRIDMTRFRFGVGEYKYFAPPLPAIVQTLREELYARSSSQPAIARSQGPEAATASSCDTA